jgi:hypothetical protein
LIGKKSNATEDFGEIFSDFHGRENHPLSPKSASGLIGQALGFTFISLGPYQKKTNNSSKGNMSKVKSFVKKILGEKWGKSLEGAAGFR